MSETDEQGLEKLQADAEFDEPDLEPETAAEAVDVKPTKRGASASVAWLALFVSMLSVAGTGYILFQKWRADSQGDQANTVLTGLVGRVDNTDATLASLDKRVGDAISSGSQNDAAIASLERDIEQRAQLFDSLPPRVSNVEQSIAALQGVSVEAKNTYLIAEAEYYLQIANSQLQLAGNAYLASLALSQADDRLLQLADPALTDVRRTIADELAALEVMEKPDIAGATLTLASLARVVESLPLRGAVQTTDTNTAPGDAELKGTAKAWAAVKGAVSGLVKVTPPSADKALMMTSETADLARSNLSLQLQAARLALLRGEESVFQQSLSDADVWLERYFDISSAQVSSARTTIEEIRNDYKTVAAPDISQSLRLLRQYKTLAEPQQ